MVFGAAEFLRWPEDRKCHSTGPSSCAMETQTPDPVRLFTVSLPAILFKHSYGSELKRESNHWPVNHRIYAKSLRRSSTAIEALIQIEHTIPQE